MVGAEFGELGGHRAFEALFLKPDTEGGPAGGDFQVFFQPADSLGERKGIALREGSVLALLAEVMHAGVGAGFTICAHKRK